MWNRQELKTGAKVALKKNYWKAVGAGIIAMFAVAGGQIASSRSSGEETDAFVASLASLDTDVILAALGIVATAALVMWILSLIVTIFIWNPLLVGCDRFFISCHEKDETTLNDVLFALRERKYVHVGGVMFFRTLFTALWSLLFIIPGIVKAYEYMMIPYLLAENPDMDRKTAFAESKRMMMGHKWNAFVLDLSFIGWLILGACTFGILNVFYVSPYQCLTQANLYRALRDAK